MKLARPIGAAILADALDAQAKVLTATAAALRADAAEVDSKYLDQSTSPLTKRVYLALARAGAFATRRVGKRVIVERDVFERWLSSQTERPRRVPTPSSSGPRNVEEEALAELGLVRRAGGRR